MKHKFILAYMDVAKRFAMLSSAKKLNVGAVIVKDDRIISIGYNGTPHGWDNICEDIGPEGIMKTRSDVIHAEANAIGKLAKNGESGKNATMFITHSPCMECAKIIYVAGISHIIYDEEYRSKDGIDFLRNCKIIVDKLQSLN